MTNETMNKMTNETTNKTANNKSDLQQLLRKPKVKCILSLVIPALFILLIFNRIGLYPYKNLTLLTSDLNGQYVSFYAYMKEMFRQGNGVFYTFSKTLGGDMYGLTGYYLMSPLNIIFIFIKLEYLPQAILIISILKIALSGFTMYLLLSSKRGFTYRNLIFSTSYALMGYLAGFLMNLMWLDAVFMLPLVIYGMERIYKKKSSVIYILALSFTIISCYYTGYMICLFCALYGCYLFVIHNGRVKNRIKSIIRVVIASAIAVGISAVMLIPSLLSLQGSKEVKTDVSMKLTQNFNLTDFATKFFMNSYKSKFVELPNLYCGIIITILCILYFFNRNIKVKQKIAALGILGIFFASMWIKQFDMVWHGFATPNSFCFRYAFIIVFFSIIIAEESLYKFYHGCNSVFILLATVLVLGLGVFVIFTNRNSIDIKYVMLDLLIALCGALILLRYSRTEKVLRPVLIVILSVLQGVSIYNNDYGDLSRNQYFDNSISGFANEVSPAITALKKKDNSFYRMEKTFYYSLNDPMLLGYNGVSHFSSTEKSFVKDFMKKMGYTENNDYWAYYNYGSTTAADSFLGIKYILSRDDLIDIYKETDRTETIKTYFNPYALPLGFLSSQGVKTIDMDTADKFLLQNDIYNKITGVQKDIFEPVTGVQMDFENVTEYVENNHNFYKKVNDSEDSVVHYLITADSEDPVYLYLPSKETNKVEISVNGKSLGEYFDVYRHDIVSIGKFTKGNVIDVGVKLLATEANYGPPQLYYQRMDTLKNQVSKLQQNAFEITQFKSSHIEGTIDVKNDNQLLMFTIPYDKNWTIKVDGKKMHLEKVADTFIAIKVNAGSHQVSLNYVTPGFELGKKISIVSGLIFLLYLMQTLVLKKIKQGAYHGK